MKKRILFVVSTLNNGGAQKIISNIIMNLPKEWDIDLVLNDTDNIVYPYRGNIIDLGLRPQLDKTSVWYQAKVFFRRMIKVYQCKKTGSYAACISALVSANAVNVLTGKKYCKTILTEHNYMSKDCGAGIRKWITKLVIVCLYNHATHIVAVSKGIAEDLIDKWGIQKERVTTIYNGYLLDRIREQARESLDAEERKWLAGGQYNLVTVGRLSKQKGQWHLIRALVRVKEKYANIRLLVLGEGELEDTFRTLISKLQLEDNVIICGFRKNPFKLMSKCDAFILPSLYEGFGNVIVESLCVGIPCISTDFHVGAREILAPETDIFYRVKDEMEIAESGILCPVCYGAEMDAEKPLTKEEEILAEAIMKVLEDKQLSQKMIENGKKRAEDFDMNKIIKSWIKNCED